MYLVLKESDMLFTDAHKIKLYRLIHFKIQRICFSKIHN